MPATQPDDAQQRLEERRARLTARVLEHPSDADAWLARGKIALLLDRPASAGRDLRDALLERPALAAGLLAEHPELAANPFLVAQLAPETALAAAVTALADERAADALAELELAELLDRSNAAAEFIASTALPMVGRDEEALHRAELAAALWPRFADAHFNVGSAYAEDGDDERAMVAYRRVLAIEPDHDSASHNLIVTLRQLDRLPEAREIGAPLRTLAPLAFIARYRHAETLVLLGALDAAREELAALLPCSEAARHALPDNEHFAPLLHRPDWKVLIDL